MGVGLAGRLTPTKMAILAVVLRIGLMIGTSLLVWLTDHFRIWERLFG